MNLLIGFFAVLGVALAARVVVKGLREQIKETKEFHDWKSSQDKDQHNEH